MTRFALLLSFAALLIGCPTLKLGTATVADKAPKGATFTLLMDVIVEETDVTDGEEGQPASGRGVIGLHLPVDWTVTAARVQVPGESVMRRVYPSPLAAAIFAETFPTIMDPWWAFASSEMTILQGRHTYRAELDIAAGKAKAGDVGMLLTVLADSMDEIPAPAGYTVTMKGKKTTITAKTGPAPTGVVKDKVPAGK